MVESQPFNALMLKIVANERLHARWLNTLSYLEYVGFRKIVKSQDARTLSLATLQHANEEGRHAMLLKKLCLKIGGPEFDNYQPPNLLCADHAEAYFQNVDHRTFRILSAIAHGEELTRLTYLSVTWLVEVRALEVYGAYTRATATLNQPTPLASLLKEEERHLAEVTLEMTGRLPEAQREALVQMESVAYHEYMRTLEHSLQEPLAAHGS